MAYRHRAVQVGTTATELPLTEFPGFIIQNHSGKDLYIGGSDVTWNGTTTEGYKIEHGSQFEVSYEDTKSLTGRIADRLYGVVHSGTANVVIFIKGRVLS